MTNSVSVTVLCCGHVGGSVREPSAGQRVGEVVDEVDEVADEIINEVADEDGSNTKQDVVMV